MPNVTVPNAMLPNVTVPNTMLPNVSVPNTMLPNVTVYYALLPNVTVPYALLPNVKVLNAIILPVLHAKWNTSDYNMRFKHPKQLNAATAWTQMATLLQLRISKAKSATLAKTKQA